jgi:lipopolysaccharide biosynthesis glycosyltransferase
MKTIIVSAFDDSYFNLGVDLIDSIRNHSKLDSYDIAILDLGLSKDNLGLLEKHKLYIKEAFWNIRLTDIKCAHKYDQWFKAMVARPFLPEYFPEYDVIIWLDADIWIQQCEAILDMTRLMTIYPCCAVPEIDRSYSKFNKYPNIWVSEYESYKTCFDENISNLLLFRPQINTGMLVMRRIQPLWKLWQEFLAIGLKKETSCCTVEQYAFNAAVYSHDIEIGRMPSTHNWLIGNAVPYYNYESNKIVEASPPFIPISILHLTKVTMNTSTKMKVIDNTGNIVGQIDEMRPEYVYWRDKIHHTQDLLH